MMHHFSAASGWRRSFGVTLLDSHFACQRSSEGFFARPGHRPRRFVFLRFDVLGFDAVSDPQAQDAEVDLTDFETAVVIVVIDT